MKGVSRKYNILFTIAVLLLAALGLGVFGACSYNNEEQNIIDRGWVYLVTYDAAGGSFDSTVTSETEEGSSAGTEYARVQANSLTVEPGYTPPGAGALNIIPVPQKTGYTLDGWYLVKEDGSLAVNAWDFSSDRVNSDITLRANWVKKGTLEFYAIIGGQETQYRTSYSVEVGENVISRIYDQTDEGETILRADYIKDALRVRTVGDKEYTALAFYWDKEFTQPLTQENAVFPEGTDSKRLYVQVLEGEFDMITQETVDTALERGRELLSSDSMWYILEDLDFTYEGAPAQWGALQRFDGVIYGNGHTLSNLVFRSQVTYNNSKTMPDRAVFGIMSGRVEDIVFENVTLTVWASAGERNTNETIDIAFLATSFEEDGVFTDIAINNCGVKVINNLREDGTAIFAFSTGNAEGHTDNWLSAPVQECTVMGTAADPVQEKDDTLTE